MCIYVCRYISFCIKLTSKYRDGVVLHNTLTICLYYYCKIALYLEVRCWQRPPPAPGRVGLCVSLIKIAFSVVSPQSALCKHRTRGGGGAGIGCKRKRLRVEPIKRGGGAIRGGGGGVKRGRVIKRGQ